MQMLMVGLKLTTIGIFSLSIEAAFTTAEFLQPCSIFTDQKGQSRCDEELKTNWKYAPSQCTKNFSMNLHVRDAANEKGAVVIGGVGLAFDSQWL
jgi:hypothetical protein